MGNQAFAPAILFGLGLSCAWTAHADFTVQPPVPISSARSPQIAASADGQDIIVSWYDPTGAYFRRSGNGGASFGPQRLAIEPPSSHVEGLWFDMAVGSAALMSADGQDSYVMASVTLQTDPFYPPPRLPPMLQRDRLGLASTAGAATPQKVAVISDACSGRDPLGCGSLGEFHLAGDAGAQHVAAVFRYFAYDGPQGGDTIVAIGQAGGRDFERIVNLSEQVLPTPDGSASYPRIAMDASGQKIFVTWVEDAAHLVRSLDGGTSWARTQSLDEDFDSSGLAYASGAGTLVFGFQDGFYFDDSDPSLILVRTSSDDGDTLSAPVTVAAKQVLGGGDTIQVTGPVSIATSNDAQTIAVLHAEELCSSWFGCTGGSIDPFDVVLSVSEDGGTSFQRLGIVGQSSLADYDLAITADGDHILVATDDVPSGGTIVVRADRSPH